MRLCASRCLVLALASAVVLAQVGCKRLPFSGAGESEELPAGAVQVPSATPAPAPTLATPPVAEPLTVTPPVSPSGQSAPMSFAPIAKRVDASVVTIMTTGEEDEVTLFGRRRRETQGLGTGFVVDKDGVILTNNHVVKGADQILVKLADERVFPAKVVGTDPQTDVAVIRIAQSGFTPLTLGDSDRIEVGDWVVAIGNPFGLEHTVSQGIVSGKGRTKEEVPLGDPTGFYDFLQTDASINPGNSGGPLLNLHGEVIGINAAIHANATGVGFAIPINMVKQLLPMLLRDGQVSRSAIGVRIADLKDLTDDDKKELKITTDKGAVIEYVAGGGPADRAGIAVGDVITAFDGKDVARGKELQWMASTTGVGKTVNIHFLREGKPKDAKVTLGILEAPTPHHLPAAP